MFFGLRKLLRASASMFSLLSFAAEPEALPPIFAPKISAAALPLQIPAAHAEISDRVRRLLAADYLAKKTAFSAAIPAPPTDAGRIPVEPTTIVMENFFVRSSPLRSVEFAKPASPVVSLLKHGLLYHSVGKNFDTDGFLSFAQVASYTSGNGGTAPKVEIRFNFRW